MPRRVVPSRAVRRLAADAVSAQCWPSPRLNAGPYARPHARRQRSPNKFVGAALSNGLSYIAALRQRARAAERLPRGAPATLRIRSVLFVDVEGQQLKVTIVDYANSNANSVLRALSGLGVDVAFSRDAADISSGDFLILPGVGHTGTAMRTLRSEGLIEPLRAAVFDRKVPVLGICLGMQIMTDYLEEGECAGLGWIPGQAVRLTARDSQRYKIPHIGWNRVEMTASSRLIAAEITPSYYYFCHKYAVTELGVVDSFTTFDYESKHIASFERDNIYGVQFHPEKSQDVGRNIFRNFIGLKR